MSSDSTEKMECEIDIESELNSDLTVDASDSKTAYSNIKSKLRSSSNLTRGGIKPDTDACVTNMLPGLMLFQNTSGKRKHNTLSLGTKMEIIQRLENGESAANLAQLYNVGRATIFDIKSKKQKIQQFASGLGNEHVLRERKTLRKSKKKSDLFRQTKNSDKSDSNRTSDEISNTFPATENSDKSVSKSVSNEKSKTSPEIEEADKTIADEKSEAEEEVQEEVSEESIPSGSNSSAKRKHIVLSLEAKLEIIQRLEKGESITSLAQIYNVGRATVFDIKSKKDSILSFAGQMKSEDDLKTRKTMRKANDTVLEEALYLWYVQRLSQGHAVTGPLLCEKALELNAMFGGSSDFKASSGWLKNFRARFGINFQPSERQLCVAEKPPVDNSFLDAYLNLLQQEGYSMDDIYTADKMEINLNTMPKKSFIFQHQSEDIRKSLENVTILLCANSNWNHALPLLMIGKSKKEKCFKNISCLPVIYRSQEKSLVNCEIFMDWYVNEFITAVKKVRDKNSKCGKVLLLLHNADFLPNADELNAVDADFQVMIFPENVSHLVHSMDQNILKKLKTMFKLQVLTRLLLTSRNIQIMTQECLRKIDLKDFCYMLADTWSMLAEEPN